MAEKKRGSEGGESFHPEGGKAFNLGRIFMGISEDYAARHLSHEKDPRDFVPHYTNPKQHPLFRDVPKAELNSLTDEQAANILAMAHAVPVKPATPPGVRPDGKPDFNYTRKFHYIDKMVGALAAPVRGAIHSVGLHTEDVVGRRQGDIPFEYNGHRGKFLYNSLVHNFARFAGEMIPETMAESLPLPVSAYLFRHQEGLAHGMDRLLSPFRFSTERDRQAAIAKQVAKTAYLDTHPEAAAAQAAKQTAQHWHYADSADALEAHLAGHHNIPFKQTLHEYFRKRVIDPTGTPRGNREDDLVPGDLPPPVAAAADVAPGEGGHHGGLKSGYVHMRPAAAAGIGLAAGMAAGGLAGEPTEAAAPESTVDAHAMDTASSLGELKSQSQADLFAQLIGTQNKTNDHLEAIAQILERLVESTNEGRLEAKETAEQKEASEHREKHGKKDAHAANHADAHGAHASGHPTATVGRAESASHPVNPDGHADPATVKTEVETLKKTEQHVAAQAKDTAKVAQGVAKTNQLLAAQADLLNAGFGFRTMNTAMMSDARKAFGLGEGVKDVKDADKLGTAALQAKKVKDHASAIKEAAHLYALKKLLGGAATGAATAGAGAAAAGAAEGAAGAAAGAAEGIAGAAATAGIGAMLMTPAGIGLLVAGTVAGIGAWLQHRRSQAERDKVAAARDSNYSNPAGHLVVKPPSARKKGPDGLPVREGITDYYDKHPQYRPKAPEAAPAVPSTLHGAGPHQEIQPPETPDGQYLNAGAEAPVSPPARTFNDANREAIEFWQQEVSRSTWADHDDGSLLGRMEGRTNDAISYWQHQLDGKTPAHRSKAQAQADARQNLWARIKSRTADAYRYWHGEPRHAAPGGAKGHAPLPFVPFTPPQHATRGVRNNNPGNVEQDKHNPWLGTTHNGREHRFAVFTSPEYGVRALAKNLLAYQDKHHLMTLRQIIARHAPASENNTAAYIKAVSKATGINPDAKIDLHDSATMEKVSAAIIAHENAGFHYPDAILKRGVSMAEGPNAAATRIAHDAHVPGANAHNVHATARHVSGSGDDPFSTVKDPNKFGQTAAEQAKAQADTHKKNPSFWDKLVDSAKGLVDSTRHLFFAPNAGEDRDAYGKRVDATLAQERNAHTDMYGHVNPLLARMRHAGHQAVNDLQAGAHHVGEIAHAMGEQAKGIAGNAVSDAQKMLGKSARVNDADLKEYLKTGGVHMDPAKAAWCAAFVNASLGHEGIKGTGSLTANSFQTWGQAVKPGEVQRGDVVLNTRGHGPGQVGGHVGMATGQVRRGKNGELEIEMISGNSGGHGGAVRTTWEPASQRMIRRATSDDLPNSKLAGGPDRVVSPQTLSGHAFGKNSGIINAAINRAASANGVSALDMATMLKIEDPSGNLHAVSPTGAKGLYQFTSKTGARYGLHGNDAFDPNKNAAAAAQLWQDNVKGIKAYNAKHPDNPIPVTGWTTYLAHQEGVAGLTNIWESAHGQASLKGGVRRNMDVNGGRGLSPAQFLDHWQGKWDHSQAQLHRDYEKVPQQQKGQPHTQEVKNGSHADQTAEQLAAQDRAINDAYAQVGRATAAGYRSQYGPTNAPDSAARDQSINDAYAQVGRATGEGFLTQYGRTNLPDSLARDQSINDAYAQVGRATAAGYHARMDPRFSTASSLAGTAAGMLGGNAFSTVTAAAASHQREATMNHFSDSLNAFGGQDFIQHPDKALTRMVNPMGQVMNDPFAPGVGGMVGGGMGAGGDVGAVGQDGGMPVVSGDNTEMHDSGPDKNQVSYNSDSHSSSISTITGATMMDNDQTNETNKAPVDIGSIGLLLFNSSLL